MLKNQQNQMSTDTSTFSGNANETTKSNSTSEIIEKKPIPETPYVAVKVKLLKDNEITEKWFLTLGRHRVADNLPTYEACVEESEDTSWFRILAIINMMIDNYHDHYHGENKIQHILQTQLEETINKQQLQLNLKKEQLPNTKKDQL